MLSDTITTAPSMRRRAFIAARTALSRDDVATAVPIFEELASARPDDLELRLYAAWARARLAPAESDKDRSPLEALARQVLGDSQSVALPLCILGYAALRRGELRIAHRLFRRALEAEPSLGDARRGERMTEERLCGRLKIVRSPRRRA